MRPSQKMTTLTAPVVNTTGFAQSVTQKRGRKIIPRLDPQGGNPAGRPA